MHSFRSLLLVVAAMALAVAPAGATLIGVGGPDSSFEVPPAIIPAPANALDDDVTNRGMQGFDEAQGVVTTVAHQIDGGGTIPVGTRVNSHMIFLNSEGSAALSHREVLWTFDGIILGVMSNSNGSLEVASTFELGNPGTNYPAAPFSARGMEGGDSYSVVGAGDQLLVTMTVTEPGDWIRVVTAVPEPGTLLLVGLGLVALGTRRRN